MTKCQEQLLSLLWIRCDDLSIGTHAITITKSNNWCEVWTSLLSCPTWYIMSWWVCVPCWGLNQPVCSNGMCQTWLIPIWGICVLDTAPTWWSAVTVSWIQWFAIDPVTVAWCGNTQWQTITYSIVWTLPTWISFDPNTRTFSWIYTWSCPASSSVSMRCTDTGGLYWNTVVNFSFTCPNSSPVWPWSQSYTITEWSPVSITVPWCTDADWNPLTYSMTWLPSWLSFNPTTREITWTYTWSCPTTVNATMTCSDWSISVNTTISFTINCWVALYTETKCFAWGTIIDSSYPDFPTNDQAISFGPIPSNPPAWTYQLSINFSWTQVNQFSLPWVLQVEYIHSESSSIFTINHWTDHNDPYSYSWTSPSFTLNGSQWTWIWLHTFWSTIPTIVLDWTSCVTLTQIA